MTLCISLKTKTGIVLASDSRVSYTDGRLPKDTAIKLYTANRRCGILVSGKASFYIEGRKIQIVSLLDAFTQNTNNIDINGVSKDLHKFMSNKLGHPKGNKWDIRLIASGYNEDTYETHSHRVISINQNYNRAINTRLVAIGAHLSVRLLNSLISPKKYQHRNPEKHHNKAAIEKASEIARGKIGIRLRKLDDLISKDEITMRQGVDYCRLMISAVSEFKETVGGKIDIATIKPGKGFRWKTNHHKRKTAKPVS